MHSVNSQRSNVLIVGSKGNISVASPLRFLCFVLARVLRVISFHVGALGGLCSIVVVFLRSSQY